MADITQDTVRQLAAFKGKGVPVTTCYLDVDGRRHPRRQDVEVQLGRMMRQTGARANGTHGTHDASEDLRRISAYVRGELDRSRTRGLAIFSCAAADLFEVLPLPVPVRNQLVVNNAPALGQLESVIQQYERLGVVLVDKQRARMLVFELGDLVDRSELFDELPRDYDHRGEKERGDVANHVEALTHQHLRRAAEATFRIFQRHGFERLCVGATEETARAFESLLHPYLRERLCGRVAVTVAAPLDEIRAAALDVETAEERRREARQVERLREAVGARSRGAAGLKATLAALNERRVEQLLVSDGYVEAGWRCHRCDLLAAHGRTCAACGGQMAVVEDVVEDAVDVALGQSCAVEVCVGNADLDVLGRIGALLRY